MMGGKGDLSIELADLGRKEENKYADVSVPRNRSVLRTRLFVSLHAIWAVAVFILLVILVATNVSFPSSSVDVSVTQSNSATQSNVSAASNASNASAASVATSTPDVREKQLLRKMRFMCKCLMCQLLDSGRG